MKELLEDIRKFFKTLSPLAQVTVLLGIIALTFLIAMNPLAGASLAGFIATVVSIFRANSN